MKAQIIEQLKQTTDSNKIDKLLERLYIIMYLEKFEIMRELLNHLGSKPLINIGGAGMGEIISLTGSNPVIATN